MPTLLGDCLDALAVKVLAALDNPLPLRVFTALAAVTVPATVQGNVPGIDPEMTAGTVPAVVVPESGRGGGPGSISDTSPGTDPRIVPGTVAWNSLGTGSEMRGRVVGGVMEIVRNRMRGQRRVSKALLEDEVRAQPLNDGVVATWLIPIFFVFVYCVDLFYLSWSFSFLLRVLQFCFLSGTSIM